MRCSYCHGLTLIEMLVTLAIIGLTLSFTISHWGPWLNRARHHDLVLTYQQAFSFARGMAVNHRHLVTVCPRSPDGRCVDDWNKPASIFPDADNNREPDNGEVWRVVPAPGDAYKVRSRTGGRGYFQFSPNGMIFGMTGSLVLCPNRQHARMSYLAINRGGRFRSVHSKPGEREIELRWTTIHCP